MARLHYGNRVLVGCPSYPKLALPWAPWVGWVRIFLFLTVKKLKPPRKTLHYSSGLLPPTATALNADYREPLHHGLPGRSVYRICNLAALRPCAGTLHAKIYLVAISRCAFDSFPAEILRI
jgi:hypothetical protein